MTLSSDDIINLKPYAKIDQVLPDSPAHQGGLRDNDLLLCFGHLTLSSISTNELNQPNENIFNLIPNILKQHIGKELKVIVIRLDDISSQEQQEGQRLIFSIYPKSWSGRGILGCHFSPLNE